MIAQTKTKVRSSKNRVQDKDVQEIREWAKDLYLRFRESAEKRKEVLETFDEAIEHFAGHPRIPQFFENLKSEFLKWEVKFKS